MPIVQLPDGTHVDVPDEILAPKNSSIFPGWLQDAAKFGPGFLKETGKVAVKGAGETLSGVGSMMESQFKRTGNIPMQIMSGMVDFKGAPDELEKNLPDSLHEDKMFRRMVKGGAGALMLPIPGVGPTRQFLAGAGAGGFGQGGRMAAESVTKNSQVADWADTLSSMAGGVLTGFGLGPKQTQGQREVREAAKGLGGIDFDAAHKAALNAEQTGAKTATAAEMFPEGSGVQALASKTRAMGSNNPLRVQTMDRPNDIQGLADEFLNRMHPGDVSPARVANQTTDAANTILASTKQVRSDQIRDALKDQHITPDQANVIQRNLGIGANMQNVGPAGEAFRYVQNALQGPHGPLTSLQDISLELKRLGKMPNNPNAPLVSNGKTISDNDMRQAIQTAESMLDGFNSAYRPAMNSFKDWSENVLNPMRQGPIGSLADRNPLTANATPVGKLEAFVKPNTPQEVEGYGRALSSTGDLELPQKIAKALAQSRLEGNPANPAMAVRGTADSPKQQKLEGLLNAGGVNAENAMAPLSTIDRLQPFNSPANMNDIPKMSLGQAIIRPFRTADMAITGHGLRSMNREVGELLANPSPANIRRLQEISMFDPSVRRMLTVKGLIPTESER